MKEVKITNGRFKGKTFEIEGTIKEVFGTDCLPELDCVKGIIAAKNAIDIDKYTIEDEPFYYGKINHLGYILSHKEFETNKEIVEEKKTLSESAKGLPLTQKRRQLKFDEYSWGFSEDDVKEAIKKYRNRVCSANTKEEEVAKEIFGSELL